MKIPFQILLYEKQLLYGFILFPAVLENICRVNWLLMPISPTSYGFFSEKYEVPCAKDETRIHTHWATSASVEVLVAEKYGQSFTGELQ